jgi:hypothetical protein
VEHSAEMRRCFLELDVPAVRRLWKYVSPNMPQPTSDREALMSLHYGRTTMPSIPFKLRAYSHRWLHDNNFPSGLPDALRPRAERMYPQVADAVGISANSTSKLLRPIMEHVQVAMADAVRECYADKRTEPPFVRARMHEAKVRTIKKLVAI